MAGRRTAGSVPSGPAMSALVAAYDATRAACARLERDRTGAGEELAARCVQALDAVNLQTSKDLGGAVPVDVYARTRYARAQSGPGEVGDLQGTPNWTPKSLRFTRRG
jgi:hypothetical protein